MTWMLAFACFPSSRGASVLGVGLVLDYPGFQKIGRFQDLFLGRASPQSITQFCVCRWALSGVGGLVAVMMRVDQF